MIPARPARLRYGAEGPDLPAQVLEKIYRANIERMVGPPWATLKEVHRSWHGHPAHEKRPPRGRP